MSGQTDLEDWLRTVDAMTPPPSFADEVRAWGDAALDQLSDQAQRLADRHGRPLQVAYDALARELRRRVVVDDGPPVADSRAARWRVRVRLYREDKPTEVEADSDPDSTPDAAGADVVAGLPGVAHHLAELASGFHGHSCSGLDMATLRHRLKALRPTLSRRGGNAVWRVPYTTVTKDKFGSGQHLEQWLARVDIEREKNDDSATIQPHS